VTAPLDQIDPISRRLATIMRGLMREEVEKLRVATPRVQMLKPDGEIMTACRAVALATDRLSQARLSSSERAARLQLERACSRLVSLMRKHGRWTGEDLSDTGKARS